jgi:hypothetical protein
MNILKYTLWTVLILTFGNLFLSSYLKNEKTISIASAVQCERELSKNECSIEKIRAVLKSKSALSSEVTYWNSNGQIVKFINGEVENPKLDVLNPYQLNVWYEHLINNKSESEFKKMNLSDVFLAIPIILFVLVIGFLLFFGVPFLWKFLLNRITEVSKAVKGQKVD